MRDGARRDDVLLLAYPSVQSADARILAELSASGKTVAVVVDDIGQLRVLDDAARASHTRVRVVLDLDVSYRPLPRFSRSLRAHARSRASRWRG